MHENMDIGELVKCLPRPLRSLRSSSSEASLPYPSHQDLSLANTDPSLDLQSAEVGARRRHFGPNELSENIERNVKKFMGYFVGSIQFVMEGAIFLAAGLQARVDFGMVWEMLLLNAWVGFFQEYQAGAVISRMKESMAQMAVIVRDEGTRGEIVAQDLIVGDIVELSSGSIVPADGHVLPFNWNGSSSAPVLLVDQSTITGESARTGRQSGRG